MDLTPPAYGDRALVFDAVSGTTDNIPAQLAGLQGTTAWESSPRAQARFLVHETGKLNGKYVISVDLDSATMRALGQFLVELADRAEAEQG